MPECASTVRWFKNEGVQIEPALFVFKKEVYEKTRMCVLQNEE